MIIQTRHYLNPWVLSSPWVTFIAYYHQHQREGRGNQGRWDSNESTVLLVSSSAPPNTQGEAAAALLWVSILHAILVPSAACNIEEAA